ncbi:hypothetical protein JD490_09870 [Aeromonas dhakensis]|uniref:hypothetical protein n=1 Tax=Aeromonas dhakensis TaxID=196024 RepID=UPI00191E7265|nr:hypothetical protein [Aeromonas dhakensis]MBL0525216.1 hypothetical protein [Aeromonas dhakensis]
MAGLSDASVSNYMTFKLDETVITDIESLTGGGINTNIIEFFNYNSEFSRKLVGSSSVDAYEMTCTYIPESASYKALEAARAGKKRHQFTVIYHDAPGETGGTQVKFTAFIGSKVLSTEFDTQKTVAWTLAVDGAPIESAAT